jgi:hypothetical protein
VVGGAALSGNGRGLLLVHDLDAGALRFGLGANQHGVRCIAVARNTLVAAGDDGSALAWDMS